MNISVTGREYLALVSCVRHQLDREQARLGDLLKLRNPVLDEDLMVFRERIEEMEGLFGVLAEALPEVEK